MTKEEIKAMSMIELEAAAYRAIMAATAFQQECQKLMQEKTALVQLLQGEIGDRKKQAEKD